MRIFYACVTFLFLSALGSWAQNCISPPSFDTATYTLKLPCVAVAGPHCLAVDLQYIPQAGKAYFVVLNVNATDIPINDLSSSEFLPFYDADNETLKIPAIVIGPNTYEVKLHLVHIGDGIGFELQQVLLIPNTGPAFCLSETSDNEDTSSTQTEPEHVFSWQSYTDDNKPVICYEYRGSAQFISVASAVPQLIEMSGIKVIGVNEPCPRNVPFTGCYRYDEDGNWYAQYKYDNPIADMIAPLFCPMENGYKPIIP